MALLDVSKMITVSQRLCQFAEEFTREYRDRMIAALTELFRLDLTEGQEPAEVLGLINSLILRLRLTLGDLTQSETELIASIKEESAFRKTRQDLTLSLREVFGLARAECRTHFTREKSDNAGFPARLATETEPLLRQTKVVSWTLSQPGFDLGESRIPNSITTKESILEIFEARVRELEEGLAAAVRRKARIAGKQAAKDKEMRDFQITYSLYVNMVRSAFRLAGENDLADRLTLSRRRRRSQSQDDQSQDDQSQDEVTDDQPQDEVTDDQPLDGVTDSDPTDVEPGPVPAPPR